MMKCLEEFLSHLLTSDETSHFEPKMKQQSKMWVPKGSNPPVKAMTTAWKKRIIMTVSFDPNGVVTLDFLEDNATIYSDRYCESLRRMKADYRNKRRGQSSLEISLLHNNVSEKIQEALAELSIIEIGHPSYSPNPSPCDFFPVRPTKEEDPRSSF